MRVENVASTRHPEGAAAKAGRTQHRRHRGVTRRAFMRGVGGAAAVWAMDIVGLVRLPSAAMAAPGTTVLETKMLGYCPSARPGTCSPACGPSNPNYSDVCGSGGWHKVTGNYRMRPNQCKSGGYDGWYWPVPSCGCAPGKDRIYKCHDGYKRFWSPSYGEWWTSTICRTSVCDV